MTSEESFNSALELHCRRLISLWGKSDTSRRALAELEESTTKVRGPAVRGPALVLSAATAPGNTRNKSSYYEVQDDPENKNSIPSAPMSFQSNAKKINDTENTNATTRAKHGHEQHGHEKDQNHQSTTRTSTKKTIRTRSTLPVLPRFTKKRKRDVSPVSSAEMHFEGSRNCRTLSTQLDDEQKQENKTRIVADTSAVLAASTAPAEVSLPDHFDFLDSYSTESMEDDQWSFLSPEVNLDLDEFDILDLLCG